VLNIAGDLSGRGALLLDGASHRPGDLRDARNGATNLVDRTNGLFSGTLHVGNLRPDLVGRFCGLRSQGLDFLGNDREPSAGFAGACGLDSGIEGQQVGLLGNRGDQLDPIADARSRMREFGNSRTGALRLFDGLSRNLASVKDLMSDLVHGATKLF
jgi:hypothetical protein